eukprot:gnl/TRDRNA2_/TRDRNA2_169521_c0_seq3.p1 gnl/TRDRNA2_/TRDRNA2_169521_c0~~gnl/TRDRNA2_/TRDRNA2_169521_c0_seq3.p1  ORF type:complete len:290 (-),score=51.94 gnl/TRDRNA2_/TRDRNA2_169521_c0_seq3:76-834(-)
MVLLARGVNVVGVEANPSSIEYLSLRFSAKIASGQFVLVSAAVVPEEERVNSHTGDGKGTVRFFENTVRPDWSSMEDRPDFYEPTEPSASFKVERMVPTTSCPELVRRHGIPDAMKIDIEGMDIACVADLRSAGFDLPGILSVELPIENGGRDATRLLRLLRRWGYRRCKISRQSTYQSRCWPNRMNCEGAVRMVLPQGVSMTMSGLMGDAALDYVSGLLWRDCFEAIVDMGRIILLTGPPWFERFDIHARL